MLSVPKSYVPTDLDLLLPEEVDGHWYIKMEMPREGDLVYRTIARYLLGEYHMGTNTLVRFHKCRDTEKIDTLMDIVPPAEVRMHPVTRVFFYFESYQKMFRLFGDIVYTLTRTPEEVLRINATFDAKVNMVDVIKRQDCAGLRKTLEILVSYL